MNLTDLNEYALHRLWGLVRRPLSPLKYYFEITRVVLQIL